MALKVTIESDVEGIYPVVIEATQLMHQRGAYADEAQNVFTHDVNKAIAELFHTERNKQRAPIE